MQFTHQSCSDMIARWIENASSPDEMEKISKESNYNSNSLFGAKKKRVKLMAELSLINTAIAVQAANCSFKQKDVAPIIDRFLEIIRKYMFETIEKHMNGFDKLFTERMSEYYPLFNEKQPGLALSLAFLKNLHGKLVLDVKSQTQLAVRFSASYSSSMDAMQRMARHI